MPPVTATLYWLPSPLYVGAGGRGGGEAGELLAQDHVDHARDGVGAVDGRRAVLQDLDALDGVERDLRRSTYDA